MDFPAFWQNLSNRITSQPTRIVVKQDHFTLGSTEIGSAPTDIAGRFDKHAEVGKHYFRLYLTRMQLTSSLRGAQGVTPSVFASVVLKYGDEIVPLSNVVGQSKLGDFKMVSMGDALIEDVPLTGLLPYRGGTIEIACGLASIVVKDYMGDFFAVMGDLASKLAQPEISSVIGLAAPIANGIMSLLDMDGNKLTLYYGRTLDGSVGVQTLKSGYIFISDQPADSIPEANLWIINNEPRIGTTQADAKVASKQNYMLLQVQIIDQRNDVLYFKAINRALNAARIARMKGDKDEAAKQFIAAKLAALDCSDLTEADITRTTDLIDKMAGQKDLIVSKGISDDPFAGLMEAHAISTEEAIARGLPTAEQIMRIPN